MDQPARKPRPTPVTDSGSVHDYPYALLKPVFVNPTLAEARDVDEGLSEMLDLIPPTVTRYRLLLYLYSFGLQYITVYIGIQNCTNTVSF